MFGAQHLSILAAACIWAAAQRRFPSGAAVYVLATTCRLLRMLRAVPTRRCSTNAPPPGHAEFSKACGAGGAGAVAPARSQLSTRIQLGPLTATGTACKPGPAFTTGTHLPHTHKITTAGARTGHSESHAHMLMRASDHGINANALAVHSSCLASPPLYLEPSCLQSSCHEPSCPEP